MNNHPRWDKVFSTASWIIVIALLYGAVAIWFAPPSGAGPVAQLIGSTGSQVFYCALYGIEGALLAYSKFFKRKKLRKNMLMIIYLTGFFTSILILSIAGWSTGLIDNFLLAGLASGCWLYWTFKTEYLTPSQFYDETLELRDDMP